MFNVVTQTSEQREERRFRDKPEAMNYAIQRLTFYSGDANVKIENDGGIVFNEHDIRRTFETVRA
jgi:hypothetical protein